jgi:hypothetical protein
LDGVSTWTVEGRETEIRSGDALCIARGTVHHFDNRGADDAKVLAVVTPGVLGSDYFHEVGAVLNAAAAVPPDLAKIGEIMRRHGLTPAPPPPPA